MAKLFDIIIVGGGIVGSALACALANSPYRVAIIEAKPWQNNKNSPQDQRSIGLNYRSYCLLHQLGIWHSINEHATPIEHIHISDRGHFAALHLHANEYQIKAFGYIIPMHFLQRVFAQQLEQQENIVRYMPARVIHSQPGPQYTTLTVQQDAQQFDLTAKLVIAADGSASPMREQHGIGVEKHEYRHHALVSTVQFTQAHQHTAYERFTANGPLAILPRENGQCGLVWTLPKSILQEYLHMPEQDFMRACQRQFGWRLGRLYQLGQRHHYPLYYQRAQSLIGPRLALMGNSANTIHPMAAQGLNLGLRDVQGLTNLLLAENRVSDIGDKSFLEKYQLLRQQDQNKTAKLSDLSVHLFSNDFIPYIMVRNLGLFALETLPFAKKSLVKKMLA